MVRIFVCLDNWRGGRDIIIVRVEEIRKYSQLAYIDDYIMSLPNQYDTVLGEGGVNLSGGQKQRLSIARALAKETNIIVADEPTGNLDIENGKAILELLKKVSKDKLVIVVTHNFGQVEPFITRKIRLHDGEIVLDEKVNDFQLSNSIVN